MSSAHPLADTSPRRIRPCEAASAGDREDDDPSVPLTGQLDVQFFDGSPRQPVMTLPRCTDGPVTMTRPARAKRGRALGKGLRGGPLRFAVASVFRERGRTSGIPGSLRVPGRLQRYLAG